MKKNAVLLITCPDQKGIVAALSNFIYRKNGNIVHSDQHTDMETGIFFIRIEWELNGFSLKRSEILPAMSGIFKKFKMNYSLHFTDKKENVAIFVSKEGHCLNDLIYRFENNEFNGNLKLIISNHDFLQNIANKHGIPYYHFPISTENKLEAEKNEIALLRKNKIHLIILAKYMRILSENFVSLYKNKIINIHHSFLPAFVGQKPYHQAYERGVKIVGATSHYVTPELDEGPIIDQGVVRISHRDSIHEIIRKGRDIEKLTLARAVRLHLEHKILVYNNKTIIFD